MFRILDKEQYTRYLNDLKDYHYIQSAGHDYHDIIYGNCNYVGYFKNGKPVLLLRYAITKFMKNRRVALGSFGPILNLQFVDSEDLYDFFDLLESLLKKQEVVFLQIYPVLINDDNNKVEQLISRNNLLRKNLRKFTWLDGTMVLDLDKDLDDIYGDFRKDVRYNIRRAQRENVLDVEIITEPSDKRVNNFFELYDKQQDRKDFHDSAIKFYRSLLTKNKAILFHAYHDYELVSAIMAVKYEEQNTLITYISASLYEALKLRAPTLLRWRLIQWAKENNYGKVDFFSYDKGNTSVNRFKMAFRPKLIKYPKFAYDLVVNPCFYYPYQVYSSGKCFVNSLEGLGREIIGNLI